MDLSELVELQRLFDAKRKTTFEWSSQIDEDDLRPLLHNVISLAGEVGEVANLVKKLDRGDFGLEKVLDELPAELADVMIYVMKIAYQSDIDLERALLEKMDANERRFANAVTQDGKDQSAASSAVMTRAAALVADFETGSLDQLRSLFSRVSVAPKVRPVDLVAGALLAVKVGKLAELEGDSDGQDAAWKSLETDAIALSLSYDQLVRLARHDAEFRAIFESVERNQREKDAS